jgi:Tol biopolymer transport system component
MRRFSRVLGDRVWAINQRGKAAIGLSLAAAVAAMTLVAILAIDGPATRATSPAARNGLIAFTGDKGSGAQVYTIEPDGTGLRRLTHLKGNASTPDWSPDGARIAFWLEDKALYVMNSDGSDLHQVTAPGGAAAFTPDGQHLVYECGGCPGGHDGVFLMRDDGSDAPGLRLSTNPFTDEGDKNPEVSPDGQTVTFVRNKVDNKLAALYAVDIDGNDARRLTSYRLQVGIKHDWAPDGRQIVLTTHADHSDHKSPNVATIGSDGSGLRILTHYTGVARAALAGSYSPDGRWIVYRTENSKREIFGLHEMHPDGTHRELIKRLPFSPRFSDWGSQP